MFLTFVFKKSDKHDPAGFEMGDMIISGNLGEVASETPRQSMMIVLSIVSLLDGYRRFMSQPTSKCYSFVGVDSSFSFKFQRVDDGVVSIAASGRVIHAASLQSIKSDIEQSVLKFVDENELSQRMNPAEASDFRASLTTFLTYGSDR